MNYRSYVIVHKQVTCQAIYELTVPKIRRQIAVNSGDSFTATLYAHLGAGMRWSYSVDIPGVLRPDGSRELIYDNPYGFGGPGKEVWTFKALGEGIATITMTYSFAFGGGSQNINTLEVVVEVN